MSQATLSIAVTFLSGSYHGAEWPPSPARLYQAMLAGVMTGGYRDLFPTVEQALRWLERQNPPSIQVAPSEPTKPYRISVPNNDMDRAGLDWAARREATPSKYRTMKTIASRTVGSDGPHVVYTWSTALHDAAVWAGPLRSAAHCLHTLGWGVDMAFADLSTGGQPPQAHSYSPFPDGTFDLTVPMEGSLSDLRETHRRFLARTSGPGVDTHTRPSMLDTCRYQEDGVLQRPVARFQILDPNCERVKSLPWSQCMKVAAWIRHAAGLKLEEARYPASEIDAYVKGHNDPADKSNRVSYVPLPSVAGPNADGRIRRVLIVEPAGSKGAVVNALQRGLAGRTLTSESAAEVACLSPAGFARDYTFDLYLPTDPNSRVWRSVTPVVLHGYNTQKRGVIDVDKTERLLLRAFEMAGHPPETIDRLAFQAGPLWRGTGHASAMVLPEHLKKYPRLHVEVAFKTAVRGPVLAGLGRHYGIGVFATPDF